MQTPIRRKGPSRVMRCDLRVVKTSAIMARCNPYEGCWGLEPPMTLDEVFTELGTARLDPPFRHEASRKEHAAKIAYFVKHSSTRPIELDVGCPVLRYYVSYPVIDGNHRLAAAIAKLQWFGMDDDLTVSVAGQVSHAKELGLWGKPTRCK